MLNSFKVNNKKTEKDEKDVGFTVIRVESSVSSAAQEGKEANAATEEAAEGGEAVTLGDNPHNEEADTEETTSEAAEATTTAATDTDTVTTQTEDVR